MRFSIQAIRPLLIAAACLGVALRAMVPAGFMAAPLSQGWPLMPCPAQGGALFVNVERGAHGEHHHGEDEVPVVATDSQSCPPAAFFSGKPAQDPATVEFELVELGAPRPTNPLLRGTLHAGIGGARGPPEALLSFI